MEYSACGWPVLDGVTQGEGCACPVSYSDFEQFSDLSALQFDQP